ncbi:tyrosine-type recombinase/integrase [Ottowia sp. GY511]|uniref:Tyrosine-type recombinase/integrase n=1 Tax=Ottowia flava TaxID=2675430 RepID=A0ABW4KNM6_9BURK|nr:tyrosine-type recombinase/integrase [Ottowia sp. GY511]TXK27749.1 tyrosine-type recombinase/integrase [Ottowia sp. GY511]
MGRKRERASGFGLLPRMEARPHANGQTVTYRYHPVGGKPINLGTDRHTAMQRVMDLLGTGSDAGTLTELWRTYRELPQWNELAPATQKDYDKSSKHLLRVMGAVPAGQIRPADIARYLRVERASAPVRANREVALLSNLLNVAVERGDIEVNPCRQVRRNKEVPRTEAPEPKELRRFLEWLDTQSPQRRMLGLMAEFASRAGSRRVEFLGLTLPQIDDEAGLIRLFRAKQHGGKRKAEAVMIDGGMQSLVERLKALPRPDTSLSVFTNRDGNPYTEEAFSTLWQRIMVKAEATGVIERRFTFHDLRAYYTTQHKEILGELPEIHANKATTARVYDRSKVSKRRAI